MKTNKKAFVLFLTLILLTLFSFTAMRYYENKSISTINLVKQHNYIQAKNHLRFLEQYILSLDSLEDVDKIKIENTNYEIKANIKKDASSYIIEMIVKMKESNIRIYKKIEV